MMQIREFLNGIFTTEQLYEFCCWVSWNCRRILMNFLMGVMSHQQKNSLFGADPDHNPDLW